MRILRTCSFVRYLRSNIIYPDNDHQADPALHYFHITARPRIPDGAEMNVTCGATRAYNSQRALRNCGTMKYTPFLCNKKRGIWQKDACLNWRSVEFI
mgnify:CR=1 FL=1